MLPKKQFTHNNDSFICEVCGTKNPPADKTCRNHCRVCLCSKHVDNNPGDRAAKCHGILQPVSIELKGGQMVSLVFKCEKCGKVGRNKIAEDDNREKLFEILAQGGIL